MDLSIIIPCYNEERRLPLEQFHHFLEQGTDTLLCFVDDGSTDATLTVLHTLKRAFPEQVMILANPKNMGKAESIRHAALELDKGKTSDYIAYLDADLATSLEECQGMIAHLKKGKEFVFASRILKIGSVVERKFSRFLAGRIIATCISNILGIPVYDTQCGCKVFHNRLLPLLFGKPFLSKWLFDVELFSRLLSHYGKQDAIALMEEIPVKRWLIRVIQR